MTSVFKRMAFGVAVLGGLLLLTPTAGLAASCPPGQTLDSSGKCACPPGTTYQNGTCSYCPPGQIATSDGCCPTEEAQYSQGGSLTCPKNAQLCSTDQSQASATGCLFTKYINPLIQLVSAMVGVAVVAGMIWGGIEYITSGGDPQKAAAGKKHIVNALVALVAFGLLYAFLQFMVPGGVLNGQ